MQGTPGPSRQVQQVRVQELQLLELDLVKDKFHFLQIILLIWRYHEVVLS